MTQPEPQAKLPAFAVKAVQQALHSIPMNATLGVQITDVGVGWATGTCPDTPPYRNHLGTIHAGAQFLLAEAVSGAAFAGAFAGQMMEAIPLIEKLEAHYVGRAVGNIQAKADIDPVTISAAHAQYAAEGKGRLIVNVTVTDGEQKPVMQAVAHWYIRSRASIKGG